MIELKFNDEIIPLKSTVNEFTIGEFEDICEILNSKLCKYDKCAKIFIRLGLEIKLIAHFSADDIYDIMSEFEFDNNSRKIIKEIKLNNKIYTCYDTTFKLTVKNMLKIESYMIINPKKYFAEMLAVLYTNNDCKLSINEKAVLIRENITADIAIPLVYEITLSILDNIKFFMNDKSTI